MATTDIDRRAVRRRSGLRHLQFAATVVAAIAGIFPYSVVHAADEPPLKIGVIGTGNIGGNLATLWAKAGHELVISSRHPGELEELARSLGPRVRVGTPREAAVFGDVVLISVPYAATPQIGRDLRSEAHRKGERVAIPLAGDDAQALAIAERLVRDAGFDPVVVGPLSRAREFDVGTKVYTKLLTAPQLRKELGLAP